MKESTYAKMKARRDEQRTKVQMVIEAATAPMTNKEIMANPTMAGITPHSLNHYLRGVEGIQYKKGKWFLQKTKPTPALPKRKSRERAALDKVLKEYEDPKVVFRITKAGALQLNVNGICFPVEVE